MSIFVDDTARSTPRMVEFGKLNKGDVFIIDLSLFVKTSSDSAISIMNKNNLEAKLEKFDENTKVLTQPNLSVQVVIFD